MISLLATSAQLRPCHGGPGRPEMSENGANWWFSMIIGYLKKFKILDIHSKTDVLALLRKTEDMM